MQSSSCLSHYPQEEVVTGAATAHNSVVPVSSLRPKRPGQPPPAHATLQQSFTCMHHRQSPCLHSTSCAGWVHDAHGSCRPIAASIVPICTCFAPGVVCSHLVRVCAASAPARPKTEHELEGHDPDWHPAAQPQANSNRAVLADEISLEDIQAQYRCGLKEAAHHLGVSVSTLKRMCRYNMQARRAYH